MVAEPREPHYSRTALLLQGGGALGAFHHGVYQCLAKAGYDFDWFAGTSIGGIQAAILVGNPPEQRLAKLAEFWDRIAWPQPFPAPPPENPWRKLVNLGQAWASAAFGQPAFFRPRFLAPDTWWAPESWVSLYDISPLRQLLEELIDFDRINAANCRLSLGTVQVESGYQVYFDNTRQAIDVRHVLATGALPPAFPPIEIDGCHYWDGGVLSNTPLDVVLNDNPRRDTLCFMVDLFDPAGAKPTDFDELEDRHKDIVYASRSRTQIEDHRVKHDLRRAVSDLFERLPESVKQEPDIAALAPLGCTTITDIVHLIYRGQAYRSAAKDYTFLRQTLDDHRQAGYEDAHQAITECRWSEPVPPHVGVRVHEVDNRRRDEIA